MDSGMQKSKKTNWKSYFFASPHSPSENLVFPCEMELLFWKKSKMGIEKVNIINVFATWIPECKKQENQLENYFFASPDSASENILFSLRNGTPFHGNQQNGYRFCLYYQYFRDVKSGMQKSKKTNWKSYFFASPDSPSENLVFSLRNGAPFHGNGQCGR